MISEQQRLDLLKVLSLVDIDMDKVISEMRRYLLNLNKLGG